MAAAKILAVDDEADFELLITTQRFRRQIRERRRSPSSPPTRISS
jgi:hypothetical protein